MKAWPDRPKGLSERSYRKVMSKKKKTVVNGMDFTLQRISPRSYFELNDACGMTGNKKNTAEYIDRMFKNVVVEPKEVSIRGLEYFEDGDDIDTAEKLLRKIESFLRERKGHEQSAEKCTKE